MHLAQSLGQKECSGIVGDAHYCPTDGHTTGSWPEVTQTELRIRTQKTVRVLRRRRGGAGEEVRN